MSIAKAYAKALFQAAQDGRASAEALNQMEKEMSSFSGLLESSSDLHVAIASPVTSVKDKVAIIQKLTQKLGYSALLSNFLVLLARKGRADSFKEIVGAFKAVRIEAEGGTLGNLESAEPLEAADQEALAKAFGKRLGKRVFFNISTNPSLLAGVKVTVNGVTYDGTLRGQLRKLRDRFVYGSDMTQ